MKLGVDDVVREGLVDAKTQAEILDDVNGELAIRHDAKPGKPPTVSRAALERYLAAIPENAAAALHRAPAAAEANAKMALDFGERFKQRMETLTEWLTEVDSAKRTMTVDGHEVDLGPDWQARKAMMSEERRWLQLYADLMERIYNAEQIRLFQAVIIAALRDVEPEFAKKIERVIAEATDKRAAALLGVAAS